MAFSKTQRQHIGRNLQQRLFKPKVGIIGGYHGGNLGDLALGESVKEQLDIKSISSGLQTIYNLNKWPATELAIIGGGACGYTSLLRKVMDRYQGQFNKVGFVGVDFTESNYPDDCIDFLKGAAFISCRSVSQKGYLQYLTGREDVLAHHDIVFALAKDYCRTVRKERDNTKATGKKKMVVNVAPLYSHFKDGKWQPLTDFAVHLPFLFDNFEQMQSAYKSCVRDAVSAAIEEGYNVYAIPFTPQDEILGETFFSGLAVQQLQYKADTNYVLKFMASADRAITTRLHATIFAIKLGLEISPIAYAEKNVLMLEELGLAKQDYLTAFDLADGARQLPASLHIDDAIVRSWEESSTQAINACIGTVGVK